MTVDCSKHHCITKSMSWKKCMNIHSEEKTLWSWIIWQNCCQETTVEEANQCQKAHKDWTIDQWNKVLWTDELKFEIFRSNRRVCVQRKVGETAATPYITPTIKHGGGSVIVYVCVGGLCQLQSRSFVPGEGQIESDCSITLSHLERSQLNSFHTNSMEFKFADCVSQNVLKNVLFLFAFNVPLA